MFVNKVIKTTSITITTTLHLIESTFDTEGRKPLHLREREEILNILFQNQNKIRSQMKSDCSSKTC